MAEQGQDGVGDSSSGGEIDLEARLDRTPDLNTDLREFLVIAGRGNYYWPPLYEPGNESLRTRLSERFERRRAMLSKEQKSRETRLRNLLGLYERGASTLRDLKNLVEAEGFRSLRGVGPVTIATLNEALREYGIEPITIKYPIGRFKLVREAGLEFAPEYYQRVGVMKRGYHP